MNYCHGGRCTINHCQRYHTFWQTFDKTQSKWKFAFGSNTQRNDKRFGIFGGKCTSVLNACSKIDLFFWVCNFSIFFCGTFPLFGWFFLWISTVSIYFCQLIRNSLFPSRKILFSFPFLTSLFLSFWCLDPFASYFLHSLFGFSFSIKNKMEILSLQLSHFSPTRSIVFRCHAVFCSCCFPSISDKTVSDSYVLFKWLHGNVCWMSIRNTSIMMRRIFFHRIFIRVVRIAEMCLCVSVTIENLSPSTGGDINFILNRKVKQQRGYKQAPKCDGSSDFVPPSADVNHFLTWFRFNAKYLIHHYFNAKMERERERDKESERRESTRDRVIVKVTQTISLAFQFSRW